MLNKYCYQYRMYERRVADIQAKFINSYTIAFNNDSIFISNNTNRFVISKADLISNNTSVKSAVLRICSTLVIGRIACHTYAGVYSVLLSCCSIPYKVVICYAEEISSKDKILKSDAYFARNFVMPNHVCVMANNRIYEYKAASNLKYYF